MNTEKSLLSSLFDFDFEHLVYMRLARIVYKIFTVLWAIYWVILGAVLEITLFFSVFSLFQGEFGIALASMAGLALWPAFAFCMWFLGQAGIRAGIEVVLVLFKIHATLVTSESQLESISDNTAPLRNYRSKTS